MSVSDGGGRAECNGGRRFEVLQDFNCTTVAALISNWTVRRHWLQAKTKC